MPMRFTNNSQGLGDDKIGMRHFFFLKKKKEKKKKMRVIKGQDPEIDLLVHEEPNVLET
jgi:hypothetical protein